MSFYGLATISFGLPEVPDESYATYIVESNGSYKKFILKDGCLRGAILQGDIAKAGVAGALIRENLPVGVPPGKLFDLNYAYFFNQRDNGEFVCKRA